MSFVGSNIIAGASGQGGAGYKIDRSLRFNSGDSSKLTRTFSVSNRKTFTYSCWVKRTQTGTKHSLFHAGSTYYRFDSGDDLYFYHPQGNVNTDALFRDPSAWYHIVLAVDTTQSTAANRVKIYVNGTLASLSGTYPNQNVDVDINSAAVHTIGSQSDFDVYLNGYLAEVNFIDGQALAATDFGEYDDNNVWQPKEFTGSYTAAASGTTTTLSQEGWASSDEANIWDGNTSTRAVGYVNNSVGTISFNPPLTNVTKVETYTQPYNHFLNGSSVSASGSGNPGWYTLYDNSSSPITLSSLGNSYDSNQTVDFYAIRINGTIVNAQTWTPPSGVGLSGSGVNSFYLKFADNSSNAALGTDSSGNSNTWTVNNLSVASGAGNDSLIDTPTNYEASPNNGGNYATLNPLATSSQLDLADGNLNVSCGGANKGSSLATIMLSGSGKYYFECDMANDKNGACGIAPAELAYSVGTNTRLGRDEDGHVLRMDTANYQANSNAINVSYSFTVASGDIIGCLINLDDDEISWSKNGTVGTAYSIEADTTWLPFAGCFDGAGSTDHTVNFGQQPFQHLPTGYQSICTTNLPDPTIADGSTAMDVALYTGNGSTQTISGLEFSPDFVWIKNRVVGDSHGLFDVIRGAEERLRSDTTGAEQTQTNTLTSFNSDGFSLGNQVFNDSGESLVAWAWDAGTSTVSNTDGSITSNVRANPSAGVSIVSWTGDATNARIGHGLGAAPGFIIVKNRDASADWMVFHQKADPVSPANKYLELNTASARVDATKWGDFLPTSTVFGVNGSTTSNSNNDKMIAYCFAPVEGFSAFGSYTGNGSSDGPFVYTGFKPAFLLWKRSNGTANWYIYDFARNTSNVVNDNLEPNTSDAENTLTSMNVDFTSNGFKIRGSDGDINGSGANYIYAAFAEHPFKTARAR